MKELINLLGQTFGRWTVVGRDKNRKGNAAWIVECSCELSTQKVVLGIYLRDGRSRSCGCILKELDAERHRNSFVHHPLYDTWANMRRRCSSPKNPCYKYYGGRGITVCQEWQESFKAFLAWASSSGWKAGLTLDRVDNNGNYEPSNCRWATMEEQSYNRRNTKKVIIGGKEMLFRDAVLEFGVCSSSTAKQRIIRGWSAEEAITTPVRRNIKSTKESTKS